METVNELELWNLKAEGTTRLRIVGLQYRPASKKLKYRLEAGFLIFLGA